MTSPVRKHVVMNVVELAHVQHTGVDVVYHDIREGKLEHIIVGKKNIKITAAASERRLGLSPGDLDPLIEEYRARKLGDSKTAY